MTPLFWTAALAVGLLWPAKPFSPFDGVPLDGRLEAIVVAVIIPTLWWLDRSFLARRSAHVLIAALMIVKAGGSFLAPEGLCARFSTAAPLSGAILTMPVDEPRGVLRSWDIRADWRADNPACTAIFDRPYRSAAEFPAWFVNLLDHLRSGPRDVSLAVDGALTVPTDGTLTLQLGEDMRLRGRIGGQDVASESGRDVRVALAAGTHAIALDARLTGERWRFVPVWNGASAWRSALLTRSAPSAQYWLARNLVAVLTTVIVLSLIGLWSWTAMRLVNPGTRALIWSMAATAVLIGVAIAGRVERVSSLLLIASAAVPVAIPRRNLRSAFLMVGLPWIAFVVARAHPLIGHVTAYSWDDWLAYQVAAARIYMHGFWLQGGTPTFDYQPLYRWINGALHMVFGDSSVGETYLDAACLVAGSLLAFSLVRPAAGFRAALLASAATLATYTLGTPWYFIGRGLSETAAAGFAFGAAFFLMRSRLGRTRAAAAAGIFAVLMFYTRLNHLLLAIALMALLLPLAATTRAADLRRRLRDVSIVSAATYSAVFAAGVALFALRTWWYTGVFGVVYGTSLRNNDTGLRLGTLVSAEPWRKVVHSVSALIWMNEPPRPDPRSLLVAAGLVVAVGAVCQLPRFRDVPAAIVAGVFGSIAGSFFAHTHNYPGRMSIHLVPFAVSAVAVAGARLIRQPAGPAVTRTEQPIG